MLTNIMISNLSCYEISIRNDPSHPSKKAHVKIQMHLHQKHAQTQRNLHAHHCISKHVENHLLESADPQTQTGSGSASKLNRYQR